MYAILGFIQETTGVKEATKAESATALEALANARLSGLLNPTVLVLAVFFVVPGFIAMKVYDLTTPSERRNFGNSLIEVVSFSLLNLLLWSWLLLLIDVQTFPYDHPVLTYLLTLLVAVLSPIFLAILFRKVLDSRFLRSWLLDPSPTGWDGFFRRRESCWVLFHLKDDDKTVVGGYYGTESVASSHPHKQQVYVEEIWKVDQTTHKFIEKVDRTHGAIMSAEECLFIELYKEDEQQEEE